jgi:hypothetical protein
VLVVVEDFVDHEPDFPGFLGIGAQVSGEGDPGLLQHRATTARPSCVVRPRAARTVAVQPVELLADRELVRRPHDPHSSASVWMES